MNFKRKKLLRIFYNQPTLKVAEELLGKYLVSAENGKTSGKIVETEAYVGKCDLASHASRGRTKRTAPMFMGPGTVYVYLIYGMYWCLNIVTEKENFPAAVLIRAIEPTEGISIMRRRRKTVEINNLCDGPGKLCQAFKITGKYNGKRILGKNLFIEDRGVREGRIVKTKRIGVDYAGEYKHKLWRFYIKDNPFVSRV